MSVGAEIIRLLKVQWIDSFNWQKFRYLDRMLVARLETLQFLVGERNVTVFFELIPPHQLTTLDDLLLDRAIDLLLNAALVLRVQQMEGDGAGTRRRK